MSNEHELRKVRLGVFLVLCGLIFGMAMGISFGINEDAYKDFIADGIAAHPEVHDAKSKKKIWRYAQRAHFHATGISAFSLGLIILIMFSKLRARLKAISAALIGLGGLYPLSWFAMFWLAPSIGRGPAHHHVLTEVFAYTGVIGLVLGTLFLFANLFLGFFNDRSK